MYHVWNRGSRKGVIAETYEEYCAVMRTIERARQKFGMAIIGYNVVYNHFHFVLWPRGDSDIPRFMKWLTQVLAKRFHAKRGTTGCGAVYQSRYRHRMITEERKFLAVLRYVEANARKHGVVQRAEAWPWGSAWRGDPIRPAIEICEGPIPRPPNWVDFLNEL